MGLPGRRPWLLLLLLLGLASAAVAAAASEGDADPLYKACVEECQKTGSLKETSIKHCMVPTDGTPAHKSWYTHEPLYLQWKEWNCKSECRYHCMMERENERTELGLQPVKYHGKWPLKRASVFQHFIEHVGSSGIELFIGGGEADEVLHAATAVDMLHEMPEEERGRLEG